VHLLYIARAQVKLEKLVDGVETYRKLVRVRLEPGAPPAFKEAIESGKQELDEVEPKVPAVRIEVDPPNLDKLELRMDGEAVPAAAVGIERPANPGAHTVQAWAPGYATGEAKIDLKLGEKKPVRIRLQPGQSPPLNEAAPSAPTAPAPGPAPVMGPQPPGPDAGGNPPPQTGPQTPPGKIGFLAGLRIGGMVPGGTVYSVSDPAAQDQRALAADGSDITMTDLFQPGGGGEIRAGIRFLKFFTGLLYFERYVLSPGDKLDEIPDFSSDVEVTNNATMEGAGLGVMAGSPRNQFGGYGELDFGLLHRFTIDQEYTSSVGDCEQSIVLSGTALRVGGGMNIPVADFLHLSPYLSVQFGIFDKEEDSFSGTQLPGSTRLICGVDHAADISDGDQQGHNLIMLGIGGDFVFGPDRPND
jgi:hypothetical protein